MYSGTIAFLCGILALTHCAELPAPMWAWLLVPLAPLAIAGGRWRWPATAAAGFLWAACYSASLLHPVLDPALEGRDLRVAGCIEGLPRRGGHATRFILRLPPGARGPGGAVLPRRLRLGWYQHPPALRAGGCWRLTVRLKRPHGFRNPGGFDYEGWLFRSGVGATGYVRARASAVPDGAHWSLDRARQILAARIDAALGADPYRGILRALAVGDRSAIPRAQRTVLKATGTAHLVAISGLHIGLVAGLALWCVGLLWRYSGAVRLWPAPRAAAVGALVAAFGYALLAGLSLPTRRALIMLTVVLGARLMGRATAPARTLCLALLVVLIWEPTAVLGAGLWLSFAAVAVILYVGAGGSVRRGRLRWLGLQWRITLGLLPLLLIWFQQAGLLAPLANLLAVPWIGFAVVPPTLAGTAALAAGLPWGGDLLGFAAGALKWLWPLLSWAAALPGTQWVQPSPPPWTWVPATLGTLLLLGPRGLPARWLGALYLAPLFAWVPPAPPPGALRLTLLDVGQGLAAVVRTHRHVLVYDTGPRFGPEFDAGAAVLVPYLRSRGIRRIDRLVVSHGDNDHIGGAASLLQQLPVSRILTSVPARLTRGAVRCERGQHWRWDDVEFRILHPAAGSRMRGNDASCVLRIAGSAGAVLLTGDIEAPAERALLSDGARALRARVLVVPHHGSRSSSTPAFVAAVRAQLALLPVGYRNRFRLPSEEVLARYRRAGARLLDTASAGAITIRLLPGERAPQVRTYRGSVRRFWDWRAPDARGGFRAATESSTLPTPCPPGVWQEDTPCSNW